MNQEQLEHFRKKLEAERATLAMVRSSHKVSQSSTGERDVLDRVEEAEQIAELATADALSDSEENLLQKIDFALEQIANGTYGSCTACGSEIPLARLEAKPSASLCIPCQESKEASLSR